MLTELHIHDFAIIDDLHLRLQQGFVVFTGETGAGKSIIIDAVEMLLGGRADSSMVRSGAKAALIEGSFTIDDAVREPLTAILDREGLLEDPNVVSLGREIRRQGRSISRVNGRAVGLAVLREIGEWLVDVHGQSEHLSLLRVREHLHLLDRFANISDLLDAYQSTYRQWERVRAELDDLLQQEQDATQRGEFLRYQIEEVDRAALKPGEDETLLAERARLANAEQLAELSEAAAVLLDGPLADQEAAKDLLGRAVEQLKKLASLDPAMDGTHDEAQALLEQAGELARLLRRYRESLDFDPARLDEVEERLDLIGRFKRKYGGDIAAVLEQTDAAREQLENITHAGERLAELREQEAALRAELAELGAKLSADRRTAGEALSRQIEGELADLHMKGAQFGLDLHWREAPEGLPIGDEQVAFSASGLDEVEFLVAPNPGEGLKPLAKIASGGETSRLMLGLKSVLARADRTPTLIFDEIDQGIGGRVGSIVGHKLWRLARSHQVLCITHLPQLAAHGDQHFRVEKHVLGGRTITRVEELAEPQRIPEMATMLGGETPATLQSARELLAEASAHKQSAA